MPYTMRGYIHEVNNRLERFRVARELDGGTAEAMVNTARHLVQLSTLQVVPERYSRVWTPATPPTLSLTESARMVIYDPNVQAVANILNRIYVFDLNQDFIDPVDVAYVDAEGAQWSARRVSKRELVTVLTRSFTRPTPQQPIYCVERYTNSDQYRLLVSIGDAEITEDDIVVWYLAKLPYLQIATDTVNTTDIDRRIGFDLEELVIKVAMLRILELMQMDTAMPLVEQDIAVTIASFEGQYEGSVDRSLLLTQARESAIPNKPVMEA